MKCTLLVFPFYSFFGWWTHLIFVPLFINCCAVENMSPSPVSWSYIIFEPDLYDMPVIPSKTTALVGKAGGRLWKRDSDGSSPFVTHRRKVLPSQTAAPTFLFVASCSVWQGLCEQQREEGKKKQEGIICSVCPSLSVPGALKWIVILPFISQEEIRQAHRYKLCPSLFPFFSL